MAKRALLVALVVLIVLSIPGAASAAIKIVRIRYDPPGPDARSNLKREFVVIKNTGGRRVTLSGWTLADPESHIYTIPTFRLGPGRTVWIHTGRGVDDRNDLYKDATTGWWNNDGDVATLRRANGVLVDRCRYGGGGGGSTAC